MSAPTLQQIYDAVRGQVQSVRGALTFVSGSVARYVGIGVAAAGDRLVQYTAQRALDLTLRGARGTALDVLVVDRYGITRDPGSYATATLTLSRPGATGAGTITAGTRFGTQINVLGVSYEFTLDSDSVWLSSDTSKSVTVTAVSRGSDYNVADATITRLGASLFDTTITATNPADAAGGNDPESDEQYIDRARGLRVSYRRGTKAALVQGARTVTGVRLASATEDAYGLGSVFVADEDGNSTQQMIDDTIEAEEDYRACGAAVTVYGGAITTQNITYTVTARSGISVAAFEDVIAEAIAARMAKLRFGERFDVSIVQQAILDVNEGFLSATVSVPALGYVQPNAFTVVRCGTVTRV